MTSKHRQARGMSLVEAMAAMAVFAFGIVGVMQMQMVAASQNSYATRSVRGALIAQSIGNALGRYSHTQIAACESAAVNTVAEVETALATTLKPTNLELLAADSTFAAADVDLDAALPGGCPLDTDELDEASPLRDGFRRFLVIRLQTDANTGEELGQMIAVVVAWREGARLRSTVGYTMIPNTELNRASIPGL